MSHSAPENIVESTDETSTFTLLYREILKLGIISIGVAVALFPLQLLLQKHQTTPNSGKNNSFFKIPQVFSLASVKILLSIFNKSVKASFLKNGTYTQRKTVENSLYGDKTESAQEETNLTAAPTKMKSSNTLFLEAATVAATIGLIETTLTQNIQNATTLDTQKIIDKNFVRPPEPHHFSGHFAMFKAGYTIRAARNIATISGLLAYSVLNSKFNYLMPKNKALNEMLASGISSAGFASLSNFANILYKNQVIQASSDYRTPSILEVGKNLYKAQGIKAFTRGYSITMVNGAVAYYVIAQMEKFAEDIIPKMEASSPRILEKTNGYVKALMGTGLFSDKSTGEKQIISGEKKNQDADTHLPSVTAPRL